MKGSIFIIKGKKSDLQAAFKALDRVVGISTRTIYPIKSRYRMMVGGFVDHATLTRYISNPLLQINQI